MDRYSILDQGSSNPSPEPAPGRQGQGEPPGSASLRFPAEDGGKSLAELAQRDLAVALRLLAERAQYITGASGAAIALREGEELMCRARAGPSAPAVGSQLQASSGLTGESVHTREILRCNDASTDSRVNRESCKSLGIASVMVMPLLREQEVTGVFELLSDRPHAFEERDVVALQRLGEMIGTAIDHAAAVKHGIDGVSAPVPSSPPSATHATDAGKSRLEAQPAVENLGPKPETDLPTMAHQSAAAPVRPQLANIGRCQTCGFPVSGSRTLCLDCEAAQQSVEPASPGSKAGAPAFLAELGARDQGWLREHIYTIGIVLMAVLTAVLLLWLRPV
jgi:putative methionine-R-sulfoxide reductase with GAF domain